MLLALAPTERDITDRTKTSSDVSVTGDVTDQKQTSSGVTEHDTYFPRWCAEQGMAPLFFCDAHSRHRQTISAGIDLWDTNISTITTKQSTGWARKVLEFRHVPQFSHRAPLAKH